uniref:arylesterase n=2 Tax=Candidatus Berkiella aquae TaxID=295108 RepID=UPI001F2511DD|nr:arylesterase [Candidatus Berkiella aquae]
MLTFLCGLFLCITNALAKPTILVMGDSLSAAYQMAPHAGWVALLENKLKQDFPQVMVINSSIVGDTTAGGLQRLPTQLTKHSPDIVIIELGGNDGLRGLPILSIRSNLKKMIELCIAHKAKVLLVGMRLPPNYGASYTTQFAKNYVELSQDYSLPLVPFFLENVALKPELMLQDRIHPTASAQPILLDNLWPALKPLLSDFH